MVINKIKNKVFQPIVYKNSKEAALEQPNEGDGKSPSDDEIKKIRQDVLKEINKSAEPPKKKTIISFKKFPVFLPKIKFNFFKNFVNSDLKKIAASILKVAVAFFIFLLILTTVGIYLAGWQGELSKTLTSLIPFPAVYVNGSFIPVNEFLTDVSALENYLARNKMVFTKESVRKKIITNLIEKEVVKQLAKEYSIVLTDKELNEELEQSVLKQTTKEQLDLLVEELYHWDFQKYISKVIRPLALAKKVKEEFNQRSGNQKIRQQIEQYHQQLVNFSSGFEDIAATANEDDTKAVAGDLGWLKLGEISPELELALLNLKKDEFSEVIETDAGYYIIKLKERTVNEENQPYFHASQIFLKKHSFPGYLNEQIKKATVVTLIKM